MGIVEWLNERKRGVEGGWRAMRYSHKQNRFSCRNVVISVLSNRSGTNYREIKYFQRKWCEVLKLNGSRVKYN